MQGRTRDLACAALCWLPAAGWTLALAWWAIAAGWRIKAGADPEGAGWMILLAAFGLAASLPALLAGALWLRSQRRAASWACRATIAASVVAMASSMPGSQLATWAAAPAALALIVSKCPEASTAEGHRRSG